MKKILALLFVMSLLVFLTACALSLNDSDPTAASSQNMTERDAKESTPVTALATQKPSEPSATQAPTESAVFEQPEEEETTLKMMIGETPVSVSWEDNDASAALKDLCRSQPLMIEMSMYGGFEQVGSLGFSLPQNDVQMTTSSGDIVLYAGDRLVVFYGSNTWDYTPLGHITDQSEEEMTSLLSNGATTVTLRVE